RPDVKVALSGQGADEPLGGYGRHRGAKLAGLLRQLPGARRLARVLPRPAGREALARGLDALAASDDVSLLLGAYRVLSDADKRTLYRPELADARRAAPPPPAAPEPLRARAAAPDPLGHRPHVEPRRS